MKGVVEIDVIALHTKPPVWREGANWWACTEPERPHDDWMMSDLRCHACLLHAEAQLRLAGDVPQINSTPEGELEQTMLSATLIKAWHALNRPRPK